MSTQKRLVWLDALKGIGILSIMRVHMLGPMEYIQSMVFIGAVAMFFLVAGFNFRYSSNPAEDIVKKRQTSSSAIFHILFTPVAPGTQDE